MPTPITHEIRKRLEREYEARPVRKVAPAAYAQMLGTLAFEAAAGSVDSANMLRLHLVKAAGTVEEADDAFVRIVRAATSIDYAVRKQVSGGGVAALVQRASTPPALTHGPDPIPEGAGDDPPIPGGDPGGHQPTGRTPQQRRNELGKFHRGLVTHRGASLFR
jgi:hypothetical protein